MSKTRASDSVEDALDQAVGLVGADVVASFISKSEGWIRACANPDDQTRNLSLDDALKIDSRLILLHFPPVFAELTVARAQERAQIATEAAEDMRPLPAAVHIVSQASRLLEHIHAAESDGAIDPKEAAALVTALDKLQKNMGPLRRVLVARQGRKRR